MIARPEWVPEWIWAEFQDFRRWETPHPEDDDLLSRLYRRMDTLIVAPDCAALWRAVDNRKDILEARDNAMGVTIGFRACMLLFEIAQNAEGVPHDEALSVAQRKKLGGMIAKQASALRDTLRDMHEVLGDDARNGAPAAFNGPLYDFAEHYSKNYVPHHQLNGMISGAEKSPKIAAACLAGYRDAVSDLAAENPGALLNALERAGIALAGSAPPVAHLASPEAARLHFVRETTKDMRFHFGQPLREPVAALTRVLFSCDMDAATVAKLAP